MLVSLDQAFVDQQKLGATLRYYWMVADCPVSQGESYEVDTSALSPGNHAVRVSMYLTDLESKETSQFSGIAVVEVLEAITSQSHVELQT